MSELYAINFDTEAGLFRVSGELSLESAADIMSETDSLFDGRPVLHIDLSEVTRSDSAGLALLIRWMRQAKQAEGEILFSNLPPQMMAIAKASGLDQFLPLQAST